MTFKNTSVCARHGLFVSILPGVEAEVAPADDDLLGRATADAELQASTSDQIGGACVLGHVQRVLVAHVDDAGADLDAAGLCVDRGQQGNGEASWRAKMHAEVRAIDTKRLGGDTGTAGAIDLLSLAGRDTRTLLRVAAQALHEVEHHLADARAVARTIER